MHCALPAKGIHEYEGKAEDAWTPNAGRSKNTTGHYKEPFRFYWQLYVLSYPEIIIVIQNTSKMLPYSQFSHYKNKEKQNVLFYESE